MTRSIPSRSTLRGLPVFGFALAGLLVGHTLSYALALPDPLHRDLALEQTGHGYLPLAGQVATRRQLADATWVLREFGSGTRQVTDAWLTQNLPRVQVGFELGSTEAIKRAVASGRWLGCLSRHAVSQSLTDGHLVAVQTRLPLREVMRLMGEVRREMQHGAAA